VNDEPAARAVALVERLFALLHDCRALVPELEAASTDPEPVSAQAERLLYYALVGAIEAGLVRTAEDALTGAAAGEPTARANGRGVAEAAGAGSVRLPPRVEMAGTRPDTLTEASSAVVRLDRFRLSTLYADTREDSVA